MKTGGATTASKPANEQDAASAPVQRVVRPTVDTRMRNANSRGPNSDMLIEENRVSIRVDHRDTGGAGRALICLAHELHALRFELAL